MFVLVWKRISRTRVNFSATSWFMQGCPMSRDDPYSGRWHIPGFAGAFRTTPCPHIKRLPLHRHCICSREKWLVRFRSDFACHLDIAPRDYSRPYLRNHFRTFSTHSHSLERPCYRSGPDPSLTEPVESVRIILLPLTEKPSLSAS